MTEALLSMDHLARSFALGGGLFQKPRTLHAVRDVSLDVAARETLALVGESGSGKTTLARMATKLLPPTGGSITFRGKPLPDSGPALKVFRRDVSMVFQDPYASLNPRLPIGSILAEPMVVHGIGSAASRRDTVAHLLETVGLPADAMTRYPHAFSGGQRQRIAIARALATDPALVIADEAVSALDVSVQSQVLNLLADLKESHGLAYLFIAHDLAVVRHVADRVAVMLLGQVVELADADTLFADPRHPYTRLLLDSVPVPGKGRSTRTTMRGDLPSPLNPPPGCPFQTRCPRARDLCRTDAPKLEPVPGQPGRLSACHDRAETMTEALS